MAKQKTPPRLPRDPGPAKQARLPGTEDAAIQKLEDLAHSYTKVLAKRQALTSQEVELKQEILAEMHKLKKQRYEFGSTVIEVIVTKEKVRVRVAEDENGTD